MKIKKVSGGLILIIGIVLIFAGIAIRQKLIAANQTISSVESYLPDNPGKERVGGALHGQVDKYAPLVTLLFVGGILCCVVGGTLIYIRRGSKK